MTQDINKTKGAHNKMGAKTGTRLVLHPGDPHYAWGSETSLVTVLRDIGLIAACWQQSEQGAAYLCGNQFLSLITFLGCAPDIALTPQDDGREFCLIELPSPAASPAAHFGENVKSARCPSCQKPVQALADVTEICCGRCGTPTLAWKLNWRRSACWARTVINVWNVYESEAVPGEALLDRLASVSGTAWRYCYIRS